MTRDKFAFTAQSLLARKRKRGNNDCGGRKQNADLQMRRQLDVLRRELPKVFAKICYRRNINADVWKICLLGKRSCLPKCEWARLLRNKRLYNAIPNWTSREFCRKGGRAMTLSIWLMIFSCWVILICIYHTLCGIRKDLSGKRRDKTDDKDKERQKDD